MDIPRKILRISAILLAGVLWSTSSQASGLARIIKAIPGSGPAATSQQVPLAVFGSQIPELAYGAHRSYNLFRQEYLRIGSSSNKHYRLPGEDKAYGSADIGRNLLGLELVDTPYQEQLKLPRRRANGRIWTPNPNLLKQEQSNGVIDIGRAFPRLGLDSTTNQDQRRWLIEEVNGKSGPYSGKSTQEYLSKAHDSNRHVLFLNQDKSRDGTYKSWKQENHGTGYGGQNETNQFIRRKFDETARKGAERFIKCLAKHHHNGHPIDNDFLFNAIQECPDEEERGRLELGRKKLCENFGAGCRLVGDGPPCFANVREAVILNIPIWEREFYNSPSKWKEIQSKSALIPISDNSLVPGLPLSSEKRDFSFRSSTPGIGGFGTVASAYRKPGIQRYFDIGQNRDVGIELSKDAGNGCFAGVASASG